MEEDLLASVVCAVAAASEERGGRVGLHLKPSRAYRLSRLIALRSKTGHLAAGSDWSARTLYPTIYVSSEPEKIDLLSSKPFIQCAVEDGDMNVADRKSSGSSLWMSVVTDSAVASVPNSTYVLSLRTCSATAGHGRADQEKSSHRLQHKFLRRGLELLLECSNGISSDVGMAFETATSCCFGPDALEDLVLMIPTPPKKFQTKLVFGASESCTRDEAAPNSSKISIWTNPAASGSVGYAIALLRASGFCPYVLSGGILALLNDKVTYIRNTAPDLGAEVAETLVLAAHSIAGDEDDDTRGGVDCVTIFTDVVRLLFRLSADTDALLVGRLAVRVCGDTAPRALALAGRCSEACGLLQDALIAFQKALPLSSPGEPTHGEAQHAIRRLTNLIESKPRGAAEDDHRVLAEDEVSSADPQLRSETGGGGAWERLVLKARNKAYQTSGYGVLEERVRLSQSEMYRIMKEFYERRGMDAWGTGEARRSDIVPFYVTSNPQIVSGYLAVALGHIRDALRARTGVASEPFYIIELGTGPGKFSTLFLAGLGRALSEFCLDAGVEVVYVMTDFTEVNVLAWESDPSLQPHFESGLLDSALLNCDDIGTGGDDEHSGTIFLRRRGIRLSPSCPCANPLFAISNYVFDSIRMDAFRVAPGRVLQHALVSTYVRRSSEALASSDDTPHAFSGATFVDPGVVGNMKQEWAYEAIPDPGGYYSSIAIPSLAAKEGGVDIEDVDDDDGGLGGGDLGSTSSSLPQPSSPGTRVAERPPTTGGVKESENAVNVALGRVLAWYAENLPAGATFTLPVSGLRMVAHLRSLSASGCLTMLVADKGYNRARMVASRRGDPVVSLQGNLALTVNLDGVDKFVRHLGGHALHTPQQNAALDVCVLSLGAHSQRDIVGPAATTGGHASSQHSMCTAMFVEKLCLKNVCDFFTLRDHVEDVVASARCLDTLRTHSHSSRENSSKLPLSCIVLLLRLSCWDPDCLWQFTDQILEISSQVTSWDVETRSWGKVLWESLPLVEAAFSPRFDPDGSARATLDAVASALEPVFCN